MLHFSANFDRSSQIAPLRDLPDGEYVAVAKGHILTCVTTECGGEFQLKSLIGVARSIACGKTSQVGALGVGASFYPSGNPDQIFHMHIRSERVAAWLRDFTLDIDGSRFDIRGIPMNQYSVARLQNDIIQGIPLESLPQVDAQNFHRPICLGTKQLGGIHGSVRSRSAGKVDRIPKMSFPGRTVLAWSSNFSTNPYIRRGLEVIAAEDAERVERLQHRSRRWVGQGGSQVEALDAGVKIRLVQPHDLCVVGSGLGQEVSVGRNQIRKFHSLLIGVTPRAQNMPLKVNRIFVVGGDREKMNLVATVDHEILQLLVNRGIVGARFQIDGKHGSLLMGLDALDLDVTKRRGRKDSPGEFESLSQRSLVLQFVHGGAPNHGVHRYQRSGG